MSASTLVDALRARAEATPERTAFNFLADLEEPPQSLTYGELDLRARILAARLRHLAPPGSRILILCPSGLESQVALWGCLYAGMVAVPNQPLSNDEDLGPFNLAARLVQASTALSLRASHSLALPHLDGPDAADITWVHVDDVPESASDPGYVAPIDPDSLALILLTSGSTSAPKGVMLSHRVKLAELRLSLAAQGVTSDSHVVNWDAPHVGRGISHPMRALVGGAPATLLATQSVLERPVRWLRAISKTRGTHTNASNFAFDLCARSVSEQEKEGLDLRSLVCLGCAGEMVHADTLERFVAAFAPCGFRREALAPRYAATEASNISTVRVHRPYITRYFDRAALEYRQAVEADGRDSDTSRSTRVLVGCGPPVEGVDVRIVDPVSLTLCDPERVGEIWVASSGVALGYWQNPEETERVFHARLTDTGEGPFCRTGDLGFVHEGEVFITGRLKETIIIRGRNVFAVDVEAAVQTCQTGLDTGATAAFSIEAGDEERLVVVQEVPPAVGHSDVHDLIGVIRRAVAERHGIQAHTVVLTPPGAIPRVAMGKIARAECRRQLLSGTLSLIAKDTLELGSIRRRVPYRPPRTEIERTLVSVWEAVLGTSGIGLNDSFAELGGDSLLSIQLLLAMAEKRLEVAAADIEMQATVARLSRTISARRKRRDQTTPPLTGSVRLTSNQVHILSSGDAVLPWSKGVHVVRTEQPVNASALARATQQLHFHHDALRLRCRQTADGWLAEYTGHTPLVTPSVVDVSECDPGQQKARVRDEVVRLRASLDAQRGPMMSVGLVRLGGSSDLVLIALHHIITDDLSGTIILHDLDTLYRQLHEGSEPRLPAKTASVQQLVEANSAHATSRAMRREAKYWLRVSQCLPSGVPVDHERKGRRGGEQLVELRLDRHHTARLHAAHAHGLSLADVLHYAVARVLADELRTDTVQFETLSHGRFAVLPDINVSRTVGFLATEFPVTLRLERDGDPLSVARSIRSQMRAIPHHGMGWDILTTYGEPELRYRLLERPPWRVRLNYVGNRQRRYAGLSVFRDAGDWRAVSDDSDGEPSPNRWSDRVEVTAGTNDEGLYLYVIFNSGAYDRDTIERFAGGIDRVLQDLVR
jgi:non-ribosomal peptide synthase protein (TIGR01720 family)